MLGITKDFAVTKIEKNELEKTINIHIEYLPKTYSKNGKEYAIYDRTPVRKWQHLNWFEYKCYLIGSLPRYIAEDGKPKVIDINFAPPQKGYTHLFAREIIYALKKVRVQSTVADLFNTTDYIVRSIMESAVENGLEKRGFVKDFKNISLDEKAYTKGHHYATILIDSDTNTVLNMVEEIQKLYAVERKIADLTAEERHEVRLEEALPIINNLGKWMHRERSMVLPKSLIGKAIEYCTKLWSSLLTYLENGNYHIDNNAIENKIRPVAIGRKNYLFAGSHNGAKRTAMFYTFFVNCKLNGVNPEKWLNKVLEVIADYPCNKLQDLFPENLEV